MIEENLFIIDVIIVDLSEARARAIDFLKLERVLN